MKHFFCLSIVFCISCFFLNGQSNNWKIRIDSADVFSSPRFADLNKDGILDVIVGGGIEHVNTSTGVVAINGVNGEVLWSVPSSSQLYISPLLKDVNNDQIVDVIIGGRDAVLMCVDGKTGSLIWEFNQANAINEPRKQGWLNFFVTQFVRDLNSDGLEDLLVTNGGDYLAGPRERNRPTARLMVLCSRTGKILLDQPIPEKRESYYAPHTYSDENGNETLIFGSGGETIDGSLWTIPLNDFLTKKMSRSRKILTDVNKGIIINSIVCDFNKDKKEDLFVTHMNGNLTLMDAESGKIHWSKSFDGYECYVTPSLGYFNDDVVPDVFTILAEGAFPAYTSFKLIALDGSTGEIIFEEQNGFNQFSPAVCADLNGDKFDEFIYIHNTLIDQETFLTVGQLRIVDVKNGRSYFIGDPVKGVSMASSPALVDINADGKYEIVFATSSFPSADNAQYSSVQCISLELELKNITWPGYLGAEQNGYYSEP